MERNDEDRDEPGDAWMACMRRGDFDAAWQRSDEALRRRAGVSCWELPRHLQYLWDGRSLEGKRVLVHCYHGLGDTVQFIRFIPALRAIAREVIVWGQPALEPLLRGVHGLDRFLPLHDGDPGVERDADVELMELPHVLRTTLATLPRETPYLQIESENLCDDVSSETTGKLKVGLVWKSGDWDDRRSIAPAALAPLWKVSGVSWVMLQNGARADEAWFDVDADPEADAERRTQRLRSPVDLSAARATAMGTAAPTWRWLGEHSIETAARVIRGLDLVITVDTLAAHLAGSLGVRTWTLLPKVADWRWMEGREDSPWYPTMRLFRQRTAGDWREVINEVKERLRALSESRAP